MDVAYDAIDLCDVLSSFNLQGRATLHEISRVMGLPGKLKGFDGGDVEGLFRDGKIKEIAEYCEVDVINTCQVWLRYELFRGKLNEKRVRRKPVELVKFCGCALEDAGGVIALCSQRS